MTFAIASSAAIAQNLNPTVEITNTYKARLLDIDKPQIEMAVPDTVLRFDLDFDYSIFDRPYKGAYAFSPYIMDMKPNPDALKGRSLYLRAGAGYPLRPSLDLIYSPKFKKSFRMNIYALHNSYIGNYANISVAHKKSPDGPLALLSNNQKSAGSIEYYPYHKGYDMLTRAGVNGGYDWDKAGLTFDVGYYGIHTKDTLAATALNLFAGEVGFHSKNYSDNYFYYNAKAGIRTGSEHLDMAVTGPGKLSLTEFELNGTFGPVIGGSNRILVDAHILGILYGSLFSSHAGILSVTPHYLYEKDRWRLSLGVKFSTRQRSDEVFEGFSLNENPSQVFYPDVRMGYEAVRNRLNLYFKLTGGNDANSYLSQKALNHFFNPYSGRRLARLAENSVERFNASVGAEGNISDRFRYNLTAGFAMHSKGRIETVYYNNLDSGMPHGNMPGVAFNDFNLFYTTVSAVWDSDPIMIDGSFRFRDTDIFRNRIAGFEPARFSGSIRVRYNWSNRIFAGIHTDFAGSRRGCIYPAAGVTGEPFETLMPGFADLGLSAEYKLSRKFSVWVAGGNLLNMTIQRSPLYVDSGINFTAGICLNL